MNFTKCCIAAALAIGMLVLPAEASDYKLLKIDGSIVKWGAPELGAGAIVSYGFVSAPRVNRQARNCRDLRPIGQLDSREIITDSEIRSQVRHAFRLWESVANIRFVAARPNQSADILIGVQGKPRGHAFADVARDDREPVSQGMDPTPRLFVRKASAGEDDEVGAPVAPIRRSLICLNPTKLWKIGYDGNTDIYDLRFTFAHEIGHAIGLDHPSPSGQLMSFRYEERFRSQQTGDIAGAVRLYGVPRGLPAKLR